MARQSEIVRITAAITSLALAVGIGLLLHTNPMLAEGETKVTVQPDKYTNAFLLGHYDSVNKLIGHSLKPN